MAMFMRKLNHIARCALEFRTEHSISGLPGIYHSYVFAVCHKPGMSQEALGKDLCMNKSSVTRHLAWLEQNGYVERKPSAHDRREMLVFPTEKMLDIRDEVGQIAKDWSAELSRDIPETEMTVFMEVLEKIYQKAKQLGGGGN